MADVKQIEQLTDEERASLAATDQTTLQGRSGTKALRLLDAHAADVAALVAQLEAAERTRDGLLSERDAVITAAAAAEAQVAELTRERDKARNDAKRWRHASKAHRDAWDAADARCKARESEVARLTEALAAAERDWERDNTISAAPLQSKSFLLNAAEARVRELETRLDERGKERDEYEQQRNAAESECAALRAEVERFKAGPTPDWVQVLDREVGGRMAAEASLAAANALLGEISESNNTGRSWRGAIRTHLAAQPATASDVRTVRVSPEGMGTVQRFTMQVTAQPATAPAYRSFVEYTCPDCHPTDRSVKCERHLHFAEPATAPARDEALFEVQGRCWPARTETEQAVLDACAGLDLRQSPTGLVTCYGGSRAVELAELARRGLK